MINYVRTDGFPSLLLQRYRLLNALRLNQSLHKLATGQRINRAAGDPAGLIAAEQFRATLAALESESQSLRRVDHQAATADAALGEVSTLLGEADALALANAGGGLSDIERRANQLQIDSILVSVDRISRTTSFNGTRLLDGSLELSAANASLDVDSAATPNLGHTTIDGTTYSLADLKSGGPLDTSGGTGQAAQRVLAAASEQVSALRARIGAFQKHAIQSRLAHIDAAYVTLRSAESQIRDLDYAAETSSRLRYQLLHSTSTMLTIIPRPGALGRRLDLRA